VSTIDDEAVGAQVQIEKVLDQSPLIQRTFPPEKRLAKASLAVVSRTAGKLPIL
jgi:hypothetical protein